MRRIAMPAHFAISVLCPLCANPHVYSLTRAAVGAASGVSVRRTGSAMSTDELVMAMRFDELALLGPARRPVGNTAVSAISSLQVHERRGV